MNGLKHLIKISLAILLLSGCATPQHPELPQPEKTAVYHTKTETYRVENTTYQDYSDKFYYDETIESAEWNAGNNVLWTQTRN